MEALQAVLCLAKVAELRDLHLENPLATMLLLGILEHAALLYPNAQFLALHCRDHQALKMTMMMTTPRYPVASMPPI